MGNSLQFPLTPHLVNIYHVPAVSLGPWDLKLEKSQNLPLRSSKWSHGNGHRVSGTKFLGTQVEVCLVPLGRWEKAFQTVGRQS